MATTATDWTRYKCDVNYHSLKVGDIVRITKATKTTMAYKKFDWEIVTVTGYTSKIRPAKGKWLLSKLPDGKDAAVEQVWDNSRLTWKSTPAAPAAAPTTDSAVYVGKSKKFKVGDKVTLTNTASWDAAYEGLPCEVDTPFSWTSDNLNLKPLKERPNNHGFTSFSMAEKYVVFTKDYVAPSEVATSEFKVGDILKIVLKDSSPDFIKKFAGLPVRVEKLPAKNDPYVADQLFVKPLRDRPDSASDLRAPFWWDKDMLAPFEKETDFKIGDRVKILSNTSPTYPVDSVVTITETSDCGAFKVKFASGVYSHWHKPEQLELTDEPLTADHSTEPFEAPKPDLKLEPGAYVKILANPSSKKPIGSIGIIKEKNDDWGSWIVKFDDWTGEHWHQDSELEVIEKPAADTAAESSEPKVGDYVEILSNPSGAYPVGSVGKVLKIEAGSYKPFKVGFKDTDFANHSHDVDELKITTEPWDDKKSAKAKAEAKKAGKPYFPPLTADDTIITAATTYTSTTPEVQKKLETLYNISVIMKDKEMSPVIRFETIAELLDKIGMLK